MNPFNPEEHPHRRWNPLLEEWTLVSPHRAQRPWLGKTETPTPDDRPSYDPDCYLCPGNERAGGIQNPPYEQTFVFDNDFPALVPGGIEPAELEECGGLVRTRAERGICRVVCYSPRHNKTLADMKTDEIRRVIEVWTDQSEELAREETIGAVTILENKGAIMGCSNPHPHGQIWATESVPNLLEREVRSQAAYWENKGTALLADYLEWESREAERVLWEDERFIALVPHWAVWPFEAMVAPKQTRASLADLKDAERESWATGLKNLLNAYDRVFETSFPYSMGIHQAPTSGKSYPGFHLHQHFFPPLLRSATVKKFQVGYEMLGEVQRDLTPEQAADRLRSLIVQ